MGKALGLEALQIDQLADEIRDGRRVGPHPLPHGGAVDPLEHDLLFERFLNPERVSMPDFDIDFCMDRRDHVIDYVARKYGRDSVSQIITFGSMAATKAFNAS